MDAPRKRQRGAASATAARADSPPARPARRTAAGRTSSKGTSASGTSSRGKSASGAQPPALPADALGLDQQVCFPLYAAAHLVTRAYRPLLAPLGLTYPQYLVMLVLWEQSPVSVGELGQRLLLDSGTLTPLLKRLQTAGLVRRQRCSQDERRVWIDLTPAGQQLQSRARSVPAALCANLGVDASELVRMRGALQHLVRGLSSSPS